MSQRNRVRCRQIELTDLDEIGDLLARGFPPGPKKIWDETLQKLRNRDVPDGFPRFGYMIESEGCPVGVLLLIYTRVSGGGGDYIRCSMSSWYVDPAFRSFAPMLVSRAMKHGPATYLNDSPVFHTWRTIEALGFSRFSSGTFVAIPALSRRKGPVRVSEFNRKADYGQCLSPADFALLSDHCAYGCLCLVCETSHGAYPVILRKEKIFRALVPAVRLIYSPSQEVLTNVAAPVGRYLLKHGLPLMLIAAPGPLPMVGKFYDDKWPRYYSGDVKLWSGDMAYTERAMFGL